MALRNTSATCLNVAFEPFYGGITTTCEVYRQPCTLAQYFSSDLPLMARAVEDQYVGTQQ